jgi:hypothetical protein
MSEPGEPITIQAPVIRIVASVPVARPTASQLLGVILRHLKGLTAAAEELQALLEREEKKEGL